MAAIVIAIAIGCDDDDETEIKLSHSCCHSKYLFTCLYIEKKSRLDWGRVNYVML